VLVFCFVLLTLYPLWCLHQAVTRQWTCSMSDIQNTKRGYDVETYRRLGDNTDAVC
jgi:hypothetical protein